MVEQKSKGSTGVPIMVVISTIFVWCTGLSVAAFNLNGSVSGLTSTVNDIKEYTAGIPELKAEVSWLAKRNGYISPNEGTTTSSAYLP